MKIPDWVKVYGGDALAIILGAFAGAKISEKEREKKGQEKEKLTIDKAIGIVFEKLAIDRGEFLHELNFTNSATNGGVEAMIKLFDEFESKGCRIKVAGKPYRERWTIRRLLKIPLKYRATEYPLLSKLLEQDPTRVQFFSKMELLNEDGWLQVMRQVRDIIKEKMPIVMASLPIAKASLKQLDRKTAKLINQLDRWLGTEGVR